MMVVKWVPRWLSERKVAGSIRHIAVCRVPVAVSTPKVDGFEIDSQIQRKSVRQMYFGQQLPVWYRQEH